MKKEYKCFGNYDRLNLNLRGSFSRIECSIDTVENYKKFPGELYYSKDNDAFYVKNNSVDYKDISYIHFDDCEKIKNWLKLMNINYYTVDGGNYGNICALKADLDSLIEIKYDSISIEPNVIPYIRIVDNDRFGSTRYTSKEYIPLVEKISKRYFINEDNNIIEDFDDSNVFYLDSPRKAIDSLGILPLAYTAYYEYDKDKNDYILKKDKVAYSKDVLNNFYSFKDDSKDGRLFKFLNRDLGIGVSLAVGGVDYFPALVKETVESIKENHEAYVIKNTDKPFYFKFGNKIIMSDTDNYYKFMADRIGIYDWMLEEKK